MRLLKDGKVVSARDTLIYISADERDFTSTIHVEDSHVLTLECIYIYIIDIV